MAESRKRFFNTPLSFYSNNDLRHITVFASPALSRRHRDVYKQPDKFWLLAQAEGREDQEAISKIDQLQKQVNVFQPLAKRTESLLTAQTREKLSSRLQSPRASPTLARRSRVQSSCQAHSMCKEHSWDCVSGQRPVRLGFRRHEPGAEKVLGVVSARDGLCLASCCLEVNTRLFGCVAVCCWGRVSLSDRRCEEKCCGGSGVSQEPNFVCVEDEKEEVLGFVRHSPFLSFTKKVLTPVLRADQLCNNSCCLLDNMEIFEADNWTALKNVRQRK